MNSWRNLVHHKDLLLYYDSRRERTLHKSSVSLSPAFSVYICVNKLYNIYSLVLSFFFPSFLKLVWTNFLPRFIWFFWSDFQRPVGLALTFLTTWYLCLSITCVSFSHSFKCHSQLPTQPPLLLPKALCSAMTTWMFILIFLLSFFLVYNSWPPTTTPCVRMIQMWKILLNIKHYNWLLYYLYSFFWN